MFLGSLNKTSDSIQTIGTNPFPKDHSPTARDIVFSTVMSKWMHLKLQFGFCPDPF